MHCNEVCTKGVFLKGGIYGNGVDSREGGGGGKEKSNHFNNNNNNNKNEINENNNNKDMDGFHTFI